MTSEYVSECKCPGHKYPDTVSKANNCNKKYFEHFFHGVCANLTDKNPSIFIIKRQTSDKSQTPSTSERVATHRTGKENALKKIELSVSFRDRAGHTNKGQGA